MDKLTEEQINLVRTHPVVMHSPFYGTPCSKTCPVCNMDKTLYRQIREHIKVWDSLKY